MTESVIQRDKSMASNEARNEIHLHTAKISSSDSNGNLAFHIGNSRDGQTDVFKATFGANIKNVGKLSTETSDEDSVSCKWEDTSLVIKHTHFESFGRRYDVAWEATDAKRDSFVDAFDIGDSHWYGLAPVKEQLWPLEKWQRKSSAFVTADSFWGEYGGVQERYLLSSAGVAILIDPDAPLFITLNDKKDKQIKVKSKYESPYRNPEKLSLAFKYSIFHADDMKAVHQMIFQTGALGKPENIPDELMFRAPIWTTWARYKEKIDQPKVLQFAEEISQNGFSASQIEIDDDWTPSYGDLDFNAHKFPDPKHMVDTLKEKGFRVTVWVHPFANIRSSAARDRKEFWLKSTFGGYTRWWQGIGKVLDVTNPQARAWFKESLALLQSKYGVASFKFDAGETNWLPSGYRSHGKMSSPNTYTAEWAKLGYEADPDVRCQELRVGHRTQHLPVMVRMMDKSSGWSHNNGLRSVIPHALTFSLLGYPFILPDMVGGNAYHLTYPDRELFIRWLQVNVFMPFIQFSICPWQYDNVVVSISKKMMALREKYVDKLIQLAKECCETGDPILRPLWWIAPKDSWAQTIDSEFLVGSDLLVAPVLEKGASKRNVYLPPGTWRDELRGGELIGGKWINEYAANIEELPYFTLISEEENQRGASA